MELEAGPEDAGRRLDAFLAATLGSRARAQRLIESGDVTVNGRARPKSHALSRGESVVVREDGHGGEADVRGAPLPDFRVAWQDAHLMVVDKPAGVVVHPARGHRSGTLAQALIGQAAGGSELSRAGIVHRLDRDTSGLLVVARSEQAHRGLRAELSTRRMRREYVALVGGRPPARSGTIDAPIGRDRRARTRMSTDTDVPRAALTHFTIERPFARTTLLRVRLETGRTHQIRVHLQAIGHPVCGDPVYGGAGRLGLVRQFLHAARLSFTHPVTGEHVDVRSGLPSDLKAALLRAERGQG